jgi:hypothetical protein
VTGGWRKLHNEEFRNLYFSPSTITIIKSTVRWAEHVARMRRWRDIFYWWEIQVERERQEDQDVVGGKY